MIPKTNIFRLLRASRAPQQKLGIGKVRTMLREGVELYPRGVRSLTLSEKREWYQKRIQTHEANMRRENERFEESFRAAADATANASRIELRNPSCQTYKRIAAMLYANAKISLKLTRMELYRTLLLLSKEINWKNGQSEEEKMEIRKKYGKLIRKTIQEEERFVEFLNNEKKMAQEIDFLIQAGKMIATPWHPPQGA